MLKPKPKMPLVDAWREYFVPARLAGRSPQTTYQYELNIGRFERYLGRTATLADLNDRTVNAAIGAYQKGELASDKGKRLSASSVEKMRDNLVTLWSHLHLRQLVSEFPSVPKITVPVRIPTAWSREELERLWQYLTRLPGDVAGVPANLWFTSLLAVLWDSGERISPILNAKWSDADLVNGYLVSRAESRKGGLADKLHKLHPETCALLRQIIEPKREKIFYWPWSSTMLYSQWRGILQRAGLRTGREFQFHCIRKSVATYTKLGGGNAQEALGHYDQRMTELVYIDPRLCPKQHAADILPRLHGPNGGDHAA